VTGWFLLPLALLLAAPAHAGDLQFNYSPTLEAGQKPTFTLIPPRDVLTMQVAIEAGGQTYKFTKTNVKAGTGATFSWTRDPNVTEATVNVLVEYTDHFEEEVNIPIRYSYGGQLSVDLSKARADVSARTLTVRVTAPVQSADIVAYGAHKAVLDQSTVPLSGGPGEIEVPWVGSPGDVVLLDVTVHSGNAWAGFTYSPWFLDIPHEDVLFESDKSTIRPEEEHKLKDTLTQLQDVLDKYGEIVPVKLYIAGCTDTQGDSAHNMELSRARAKAIASWLRAHGYDKPIFYHGFGESWLAVATPDGTDMAANRRALYMVGANPPPGGSGVPSVSWTPL
jgi:outer membrane protein OmpA-like peptidoglycan-associated protein